MEVVIKQPKEITTVLVEAVLMPNGEVICKGETIGWFRKLKGFVFVNKVK